MARFHRRGFLGALASGAFGTVSEGHDVDRGVVGSVPGSRTSESPAERDDDFDPTVHGFGFSNWAGSTGQTSDGETFVYEPASISLDDVRASLDESWTAALSDAQRALMTRIVYSWIGSKAATNGHCYGLAFAADEYFQEPSTLPDGAESAAEITKPTGRFDTVGDRIRVLQSSQLLRAEPWWFAFLGLRWGLADHVESVSMAVEAIDAKGTAGIALDGQLGPHQVLAYDYDEGPRQTELLVYDPNDEARHYHEDEELPAMSVDRESGDLLGYEGYEDVLYHDREMGMSTVDRVTDGHDAVQELLSEAIFLSLDIPGSLEVEVPDGAIVDRPTAEYADPEGPYGDAVVIAGASIDEISIEIDGEDGDEFTLNALAVRGGELVLDTEFSDRLGETAARVEIAATDAGEASLRYANDATPERGWFEDNRWTVLAAGGGAVGAGAAYHFARRDRDGNEG